MAIELEDDHYQHGFVRLRQQVNSCPVKERGSFRHRCGLTLRRPTTDELKELSSGAMERAYTAVNVINRTNLDDPVTRLRGFMWAIHGRNMSRVEAEDMLYGD